MTASDDPPRTFWIGGVRISRDLVSRVVVALFILGIAAVKIQDDLYGYRGLLPWGFLYESGTATARYVRVIEIDRPSPLYRAGVHAGDTIAPVTRPIATTRVWYAPQAGDLLRLTVMHGARATKVTARYFDWARTRESSVYIVTTFGVLLLGIALVLAVLGKPVRESLILSAAIAVALLPTQAQIYPAWFQFVLTAFAPVLSVAVASILVWYVLYSPTQLDVEDDFGCALVILGFVAVVSAFWALGVTLFTLFGGAVDAVAERSGVIAPLGTFSVLLVPVQVAVTLLTGHANPLYRTWKLLTVTVAGTTALTALFLASYFNLELVASILMAVTIAALLAMLAAPYVFGVDLPFGALRRTVTSAITSLIVLSIFSLAEHSLKEVPNAQSGANGEQGGVPLSLVAVVLAAYVKSLHETVEGRVSKFLSRFQADAVAAVKKLVARVPQHEDETKLLDDVRGTLKSALGGSVTIFRCTPGDPTMAQIADSGETPRAIDDRIVLDMMAAKATVQTAGSSDRKNGWYVPFIAIGRFYGYARIEPKRDVRGYDRELRDALDDLGSVIGEACARRELLAAIAARKTEGPG